MYNQISALLNANLADVKERFQGDVAKHEMEILHEDGLYRHVRFMRREEDGRRSMMYYFDLVTWPMHLAIVGDMHGHTFSRVEDMFTFFRESGYSGYINPQYWAEKIVSSQSGTKRFNNDLFVLTVREIIEQYEEDFEGLTAAVEEELFSSWGRDEWHDSDDAARRALNAFRFPSYPAMGDPQFQFTDIWELEFTDWDFHYLWCCHAIVWGIDQYDKHKELARGTASP